MGAALDLADRPLVPSVAITAAVHLDTCPTSPAVSKSCAGPGPVVSVRLAPARPRAGVMNCPAQLTVLRGQQGLQGGSGARTRGLSGERPQGPHVHHPTHRRGTALPPGATPFAHGLASLALPRSTTHQR